MLIPTKEFVFAERIAGAGGPDSRVLREPLRLEAAVRARLLAHMDELRMPWVDTVPSLRACLKSDGAGPYTISADGHPNAAGYDAIAAAVAAHLETRLGR